MTARRAPAFWTPEFEVERRADGSILMRQTEELAGWGRAMPDRLVHWAAAAPERTFLAERDGADWRRMSFSETLAAVRRLATALLGIGLAPDRPLLILSGNSIDHALLALAAQYAGVPFAPVSTAYSLVSSDHGKLRDIAALLNPGLVFAEEGEPYAAALAAIAAPDRRVVVSRDPVAGALVLSELLAETPGAAAEEAFAGLSGSTVAKYLFTSGSTGAPKAVITTQQMLCSNQAMVADCFRFLRDHPPVFVDWPPWNHVASGNKVFNMALEHGGTFHIDAGKPSAQGIAETLRNLREIAPTWYFNVPVGYDMLVEAFAADRALAERFFSRLDMLMYAGAGMAQHTWDALLRLARETTGHDVLLTSGLGATETGPFALMCTEQHESAGNIGVPARGVTLKLVPNEGKLEARLRSPSITRGYLGDPGKSAEMFDAEGFYLLGDALRPADPDDLTRGFFFDGRTAENFKLRTGTWVAVGALRAAMVDAFGGLLRDVVIAGEDRAYLGALAFPNPEALARLAGGGTPAAQCADPRVIAEATARLSAFAAAATGSSTRVRRMILLSEPPDLDRGEATDKGSINQRAVLRNRAALVERLYAGGEGVIEAVRG